jgi:V/A-type H+-transporting ATPase subunit I
MIRPQPAHWFEILAARDDATLALESLAKTGAVELEARPSAALPAALADLRQPLSEFAELALRYHAYWPRTKRTPSAFPEPPAATLARSLAHVRAWAADAEPLIRALQRFEAERDELLVWRRVLAAMGRSAIDFTRLAGAGPALQARLFVFPLGSEPELPPGALIRRVDLDGAMVCALVALTVGNADDIRSLAEQAALLKGRVCEAPSWLSADAGETERYSAPRLAAIDEEASRLARRLDALAAKHDLYTALGDANRLQWVVENVRALEADDLLCWITGWTSDRDGRALAAALERSGARALLHFPPPAPRAMAPLLLANPLWAKPFEIFCRALGMPSRHEADPSVLLALAVPLMFGYMFGDVGQGLVIAAAGLALRRRFALAKLFVSGGIAAAIFGVLFGSVFSLHHVLPPLWVEPLAAPLAILVVPLAGGALLLTIGLALNALEAWWRDEFATWAGTDAGYLTAYLGVLLAFFDRAGWIVAAAGALLYCIGHAWHAGRPSAGFKALAELAERLLQILINTLSFARVGAFALAHAGLSSAIVALMDACDNVAAKALVFVAGNAIVLALETMVVSIQTTRLVLFEFFTRFLSAEGRIFRPLPAPPSTTQET